MGDAKFDPPYLPNPLIYKHQNWRMWLRPPPLSTCQIWLESVHSGPFYKYVKNYVKCNDFVIFCTFPSLSFPFLFLSLPTAKMAEPILIHDISYDTVSCKEVPFWESRWWKIMFRGQNPPNLNFWGGNRHFNRVSTTPGNPGNLLEFKNPAGNPGNLLEFTGPRGNFCVRWSTALVSGHKTGYQIAYLSRNWSPYFIFATAPCYIMFLFYI